MASHPFSAVVRAAVREQHTEAEESAFMTDLLGGGLGVRAYADYTEQLWFVYRALEDGGRALAGDPVAGPFVRPELWRVPALERDLDHLRGAGWRERAVPLPATERYAARVAEVARGWPGGYVAHHYTRYLGDLSGGQVIRSLAERTWGFAPGGDGVRFYVFDAIANPAAFKRDYRLLLDALPFGPAERARFLTECGDAFAHNSAVFADLATGTARARL
ncbi:biliverdin-producing heme oxygenase [Streptomyces sp. V4-01]|uniref:Biliverdin-producing heme oxygenase n=1 Tax=Actinacidiphila polyblastidii TaxID=3110430 RepID=A0ABU7PL19_9ACTN|nr:biliverdin-producing heme oxygenase [Streptomyces sp. V4-01]